MLRLAIILAAIAAAALGAVRLMGALVDHGRQEIRAENAIAQSKRAGDISDYVVALSAQNTELAAKLRTAESRIDLLQSQGAIHVSPAADRGCVVTRGVVFDLASAVPGAGGRADVPIASADVDRPAGIPLSQLAGDVRFNYLQCERLLERYRSAEERRYTACIEWDRKFGTRSNCTRGGPPEVAGNAH